MILGLTEHLYSGLVLVNWLNKLLTMDRVVNHFVFPFLILALCGCGKMYTDVTDGSGTLSPDKNLTLMVRINGAPGYAYDDKSKKIIWIWILAAGDRSKEFYRGGFTITGSDVQWKTSWGSPDMVTVDFYDWGDGVDNYDNMRHMAASNQITVLKFALDKATGKFAVAK